MSSFAIAPLLAAAPRSWIYKWFQIWLSPSLIFHPPSFLFIYVLLHYVPPASQLPVAFICSAVWPSRAGTWISRSTLPMLLFCDVLSFFVVVGFSLIFIVIFYFLCLVFVGFSLLMLLWLDLIVDTLATGDRLFSLSDYLEIINAHPSPAFAWLLFHLLANGPCAPWFCFGYRFMRPLRGNRVVFLTHVLLFICTFCLVIFRFRSVIGRSLPHFQYFKPI